MFHNTLDSTYLTELSATFPEHQRMLSNISLVKTAQPNSVIVQAIYGRFSVSIVKYLYEHEGYVLSSYACEAAVRMRDLPLLQYLHEQNCPWDCQTTEAAIYSQHAEILHFVCQNGCALPEHAMFVAATAGNVDAMIYLHNSMNVPYPPVLWLNLYNLSAIQHLRTVGCDWNTNCCQEYAMYGKLECLIYAHENGCPWDADVCSTAACYGHLHCLKYAHEEACPWGELTMINAAQFGRLDCLKYAQEHNCPVNFLAPNQAFAYGQWRCLAYIMWRCPFYKSFSIIFLAMFTTTTVLWLQIMITAENKRTLYDFAQLGTNIACLLQFVLLIYGPRCLNNNIDLQLKLHFLLLVVLIVVMTVGILSNPVFYDMLG